ncbi:MAG TPA: hypothetical protein VGK19_07990 [Capsulimonadaceae bacterium]|jgi:hypothetical protein
MSYEYEEVPDRAAFLAELSTIAGTTQVIVASESGNVRLLYAYPIFDGSRVTGSRVHVVFTPGRGAEVIPSNARVYECDQCWRIGGDLEEILDEYFEQ